MSNPATPQLKPIPLRELLAGHTLHVGLKAFEEAMNPFVKEAMREAFPERCTPAEGAVVTTAHLKTAKYNGCSGRVVAQTAAAKPGRIDDSHERRLRSSVCIIDWQHPDGDRPVGPDGG